MIPDLDDNGNIPQGIHRASLAEIEQRFGCASEVRRAEVQSLRWLVELAKRAGVRRLVIGGSFITEVLEPNDIDCVLLLGSDPMDRQTKLQLLSGLPFIHMQVVRQRAFELLVTAIFATDIHGNPKGLVEVEL
jgi:hypothetical protein